MNGKTSYRPDRKENTRAASAPRISRKAQMEQKVRNLRDKVADVYSYTNEEIEKMSIEIELTQQEINQLRS